MGSGHAVITPETLYIIDLGLVRVAYLYRVHAALVAGVLKSNARHWRVSQASRLQIIAITTLSYSSFRKAYRLSAYLPLPAYPRGLAAPERGLGLHAKKTIRGDAGSIRAFLLRITRNEVERLGVLWEGSRCNVNKTYTFPASISSPNSENVLKYFMHGHHSGFYWTEK